VYLIKGCGNPILQRSVYPLNRVVLSTALLLPPIKAVEASMKKIKLYNGELTLVDDEDFERLNKFRWHLQGPKTKRTRYVSRTIRIPPNSSQSIKMHREIMNAKKGQVVDHIDHNGLNNQKSNLRICTRFQNCHNRLPNRNATSEYKGVSKIRNKNFWIANISYNRKPYYLGIHRTEKEAALAYNKKAKALHGEFAYLNKIGGENG